MSVVFSDIKVLFLSASFCVSQVQIFPIFVCCLCKLILWKLVDYSCIFCGVVSFLCSVLCFSGFVGSVGRDADFCFMYSALRSLLSVLQVLWLSFGVRKTVFILMLTVCSKLFWLCRYKVR